jgi:hypothetical protein
MRRHEKDSRISRAPGLHLATALLCLTSSACFRNARIERQSAPTLEAQIDRSDSENLFVTSSEGQEQSISRADVVDIDHPGKIRLATGMMSTTGGAALLIYGLVHQPCTRGVDTCDYSGNLMAIVSAIPLLVGGVVLAASGGLTYHRSVAASNPSPAIPSTQAMQHSLPRLTCTFCTHQ